MSATFAINERVLCYHGPLIYEAKILKADTWDETTASAGQNFFVHYKGWKQTWDEWVPASRLLKLTEANTALQKSLQAQTSAQTTSASSSSKHGKPQGGGVRDANSSRAGARKDGTRGTKRGREEDDSNKKPDMKLIVPEMLKVILVDDWEAVTKNNQLLTLPRNPTVVEILQEFKEYAISSPAAHLKEPELILPTIISGLQVYFDRSLGANLLYRFERPQYAEIRKKYITGPKVVLGQEKEMSSVYGAEHLLRMLVSLPQMVASSTMDADSVGFVRDYVNELLLYMAKERQRLFQVEYECTSLQYQNISRS